MKKLAVLLIAAIPLLSTALAFGADREKIVWLQWANDSHQKAIDAVVAAFEAKYPIDIDYEFKPGGEEGENLVKTRIAANDMPDLLSYNSGSLFQVLNLGKNFVDLSNEKLASRLIDSFKNTVSVQGKGVYEVPMQPISAGGIFYNKKIYAQLGLKVPKTWKEFLENCDKIKASGRTAVIASYKEDWTAQMLLLSDCYNLLTAYPKFAQDYTSNKAKFATTPAALRGFEKIQEMYTKGYINKDPVSTTYDMAVTMLASGEGAQYPNASWLLDGLNQNYPDKINDIGFFPEPGDSPDKNGATIWMPNGISIPKASKHIAAAKQFLNFFVSDEGLAAYISAGRPEGAFAIKAVKMPDTVFPAVKDILAYIDSNKTSPALEFISPVKGPNLPQICVEAGLGLKTPAECAAEYDRDVEKQAKQLMLPGW